jgi:ABC-type dipeptide/oligopeptide/nickel transport system ATPase subunit
MTKEEVAAVLAQVSDLDRKATYLSGLLNTRKASVEKLELGLEVSKKEQVLLEKVKAVLSHLMDSTSQKDLRGMDALVSYGLNTVYPEKQLEFKSELVDSGKKVSVEMSTLRAGAKASKDQHGSVSVLESLIIRVLSILKLKGARFLIADEPFSAIGADHITNVGALLEELAKRLDMDILLVTNNPGVSELSKVGGSEQSGAVSTLPDQEAPSADTAGVKVTAKRQRKPAKKVEPLP